MYNNRIAFHWIGNFQSWKIVWYEMHGNNVICLNVSYVFEWNTVTMYDILCKLSIKRHTYYAKRKMFNFRTFGKIASINLALFGFCCVLITRYSFYSRIATFYLTTKLITILFQTKTNFAKIRLFYINVLEYCMVCIIFFSRFAGGRNKTLRLSAEFARDTINMHSIYVACDSMTVFCWFGNYIAFR